MRLLLSRFTATGLALVIAAAVAQSAPLRVPLAVQSAARSAVPSVVDMPDPIQRRRVSPSPPPPLASLQPTLPAVALQGPTVRAAPPPPPAPRPRSIIGSGQWGLINRDRAAYGLPPLQWSGCLAAIAVQNAARMAAQGYISHANGVVLDLGCRLDPRSAENVGWISNGINDSYANSMFMASPDHRANILGSYRYVGVAWAVASSGAAYIAVEFS
jgi:uncharacterized protein YkwD